MGKGTSQLSYGRGTLKLDGMDEGQGVGDAHEDLAQVLDVEPDARKPGRDVRQQGSADSADLLLGHDASAQEAQGDIEERGD